MPKLEQRVKELMMRLDGAQGPAMEDGDAPARGVEEEKAGGGGEEAEEEGAEGQLDLSLSSGSGSAKKKKGAGAGARRKGSKSPEAGGVG